MGEEDLERIRKKKMKELMRKFSKEDEYEPPESPIELNDSNFDSVIKENQAVVVDMWAEWCAPCYMIAPLIKQLAKDYSGKAVFGKLNVDQNRRTAMKHDVMSIPTLLFFKGGKLADRLVGAVPRGKIEQKLNRIV